MVGPLVAAVLLAAATPPEPVDLDAFHWKRRVIVLFADADDVPAYKETVAQLQRLEEGVADRDLEVLHLFREGPGRHGGKALPRGDHERLREQLTVPTDEATLVLIGKDGTVKLRQALPVDIEEDVFALIDTMPMRQREMQEE